MKIINLIVSGTLHLLSKIDSMMRLNGNTEVNWKTLKFEGMDHSETLWRERLHIPITFLLEHDNN